VLVSRTGTYSACPETLTMGAKVQKCARAWSKSLGNLVGNLFPDVVSNLFKRNTAAILVNSPVGWAGSAVPISVQSRRRSSAVSASSSDACSRSPDPVRTIVRARSRLERALVRPPHTGRDGSPYAGRDRLAERFSHAFLILRLCEVNIVFAERPVPWARGAAVRVMGLGAHAPARRHRRSHVRVGLPLRLRGTSACPP